jgi:hypothetical protein
LEASHPRHRQYEALRSFYVDGLPSPKAALAFGYRPGSFRILCHRFVHGLIDRDFFRALSQGRPPRSKHDLLRQRVIALRKQNCSVYDIRDEIERTEQGRLSPTTIQAILRQEGFARLPRRLDEERPKRPGPEADAVADVRRFHLGAKEFTTHAGGLFLLLPFLAKMDIDDLVRRSGFPGSRMIPPAHAVRSALLLKLLGKTRRSHVMDLVFDEGVALAAGLNAIPKTTYLCQYSSRLGRKAISKLLGAWVDQLKKHRMIQGTSFNLDFHSISYFGEDPFVEKHYVPRRSQRRKAVLVFLAQDPEGEVFCYSNTDLRKGDESGEVLRFVSFWEKRYGERPKELVFDSQLTTYATLSKLDRMGITFMTLRRRSPALLKEVASHPRSAWRQVKLDIPHRKFQNPRVIEQRVKLKEYEGEVRQFLIRDLGHDEPTILITNDMTSTAKQRITRYAQRMLIENGLSDAIEFFHLDALSSAVALNVDFDVLLTVIASGIYRMVARRLRGYQHAQGRQIFRKFLDMSARIKVSADLVTVELPRRAHNPLLIDGRLVGTSTEIPWWGGRKLRILVR